MKKNLNELLARDENLDALMIKSKDLSSVSLEFYKNAKKANNKCCNLY
jgi:synaptobrevin family protein YKT6